MKLQHKASVVMILWGIILLLSLSAIFSHFIINANVNENLKNVKNLAVKISDNMNDKLKTCVLITKSFSSSPLIKNALFKSNTEFSDITETERREKIISLNNYWMSTSDPTDPFIQKYLTNQTANYLKLQKSIIPEFYGEIFLTNKYGAMIAATGKLTTLAHKQKYWWQASYCDGKGRIFFDDRGFDDSVKGYVLGVVLPIMDKNNFIGILKSNINIQGPLTDIIHKFKTYYTGKLQIARTKGLVIAEEGKIPLSTRIPDTIVQKLQNSNSGSALIRLNGKNVFLGFSSIPLTRGSADYGFGGKYESIDHIKGNEGEAWHVVITQNEAIGLAGSKILIKILVFFGIIFIVLTSLIALFLGKRFTTPLVELSNAAYKIGQGNLDIRVNSVSKDEVGYLANSINKMTENLQKILISRDKLIHEIKRRIIAEKKVNTQLKEKEILLRETHHRIKNNFASIESILSLRAMSVSNKEAVSALEEAAGRVNGMALLYEKMLLEGNYKTISCKQFLESLIKDIFNLYSHNAKISVRERIDEFEMDPKKLFPLGLIVNELLTNILKYAFNERDEGTVEIILVESRGEITLTLRDNGSGLPEGFSIDKQAGFGLKLIMMLTQQLNGTFTIESNNQGTLSLLKFII